MKLWSYILFSCLLLTGCGATRSKAPPVLILHVSATNDINPNIREIPSPIELRVYQLTDSEAFNNADFVALYQDDQGMLKGDLVNNRKLDMVYPGERVRFIVPLSNATKDIAILAAFSNYQQANNKATFNLNKINGNVNLNVEINKLNIVVSQRKG